ncbi:MAG: nucleotidyl transferase AbiEii/AbiGii toxin family protein [Planctomycetes bacterium]|nr:nucleotidyl transferase AbiEii/AbiGii toxin family protein [Planctomycetota bacterium]
MRYATASAFRTALETRLLDRARKTGASLLRLRKDVTFDRLLARLLAAAPERWVLKGALALEFRLGLRARTTRDMDLVLREGPEAAKEALLAAGAADLGDFFAFAVERSSERGGADEETAVRHRARAELAGRPFDDVIVDVGFVDPLGWEPERLRGTDLLGFAGLPPIEVPVLPLEQQVAEKVHAYTRRYAGDLPSSRPKDLVDLALVAASSSLDAERLGEALRRTFESRALPRLPASLPPPPPDWGVAYRRLAAEVGVPGDPGSGHAVVSALLDPILAGRERGRWDPGVAAWAP